MIFPAINHQLNGFWDSRPSENALRLANSQRFVQGHYTALFISSDSPWAASTACSKTACYLCLLQLPWIPPKRALKASNKASFVFWYFPWKSMLGSIWLYFQTTWCSLGHLQCGPYLLQPLGKQHWGNQNTTAASIGSVLDFRFELCQKQGNSRILCKLSGQVEMRQKTANFLSQARNNK